jgi:hypothetical protein
VVCAPGARAAVAEVVEVDEVGDVFRDPAVRMEAAPGVGEMEAILWVRREGRATLVVNDILANVRHPHGLGAHIMARVLGFGVDHPRMPKVGKKMFVKDAGALAAGFRAWAAEPDLVRVVVSHGDIITEDVRSVLERAAAEIEA